MSNLFDCINDKAKQWTGDGKRRFEQLKLEEAEMVAYFKGNVI